MALAVASARVLMAPAAGPAHDQDFVDLDLMLDDRDDPPGDGGGANEGGSAGAGYACAVCHKAFEKRECDAGACAWGVGGRAGHGGSRQAGGGYK